MKLLAAIAAACALLLPAALPASTYSLSDLNSSVLIDPASYGVSNWLIEGQNQINQNWYWYRIGNTGEEQSIGSIGAPTVSQASSNTLSVTYENGAFSLNIFYLLLGGDAGSGTADLAQTVTISNKTQSALNFHLFDYTDFDLGGTAYDDTAEIVTPQSISQTDGPVSALVSFNSIPGPTAWQIDSAPWVYYALNDDDMATTLSKTTSPLEGDVEFAFQWDFNIGAGMTQMVSKDKLIQGIAPVPEPGSFAALAAGLVGCITGAVRRKRRA
jgi:hypothetical protein